MLLSFNAATLSFNTAHIIQRTFLLLLTLPLLAGTLAAQNAHDAPLLEPGKPIERELAGGQSHSYQIILAAGQYSHVVVEQRGIDVAVALFAPDGKKLGEMDSPNGSGGPESLSLISEAPGVYRLEVRSLDNGAIAGYYQVRVVELRAAATPDRARVAAERAFAEAIQLAAALTAEALRKSIAKCEAGLPAVRAAHDRFQEAIFLSALGDLHYLLSETQQARDAYAEALRLYDALGDHSNDAYLLNSIGQAYDTLGEKQQALDAFAQSLALSRAAGDRYGQAAALNNTGNVYNTLGEMQKALDFYSQALPLIEIMGDRLGEAIVFSDMALAYDSLGEYQKALDFNNRALTLQRAVGNRAGEAMTLNNISTLYSRLGENQKALDVLKQALPISQAESDRGPEALTLSNMASLYRELGDTQKALGLFNQALLLWRAIGDRRQEASTLNNSGIIYDNAGEKQKALDIYNQALLIRQAIGDRSGEAQTLNNMAMVYVTLNQKQKALDLLNKAAPLMRAVGNHAGEALTLNNIAHVELDQGNLLEALKQAEAAIAIVEALRIQIASQELRTSYFASMQDYYNFYIDLLMRLHKQRPADVFDGKALQASERGRARSLLETLAEANADIRQGVDPKLVERERTLQRRLNAKAKKQMELLSGAHTEEQAKAITGEIEALTTEFQQVETQIRQSSPRYAALTQPLPLTLKEIQTDVLDRDTLLLEYSLGTERSYLWAVTPESITSYELPKRDEIEAVARRVYDILNTRNQAVEGETLEKRRKRIIRSDAQYAKAATQLSGMILAPVANQLGNKRLLVVADGVLQYIPFAALINPSDNATPLVVKHEIVNLPSASTISVLRREIKDREPAAKAVAVLADPVFEETDERVKSVKSGAGAANRQRRRTRRRRDLPLGIERSLEESGLRGAGFEIPRLPGTRLEAERILALITASESKKAFDFNASRATATVSDIAQYRFIHFATHGFLNSLHPELSGIVLSMVDEQGKAQDGFLRANEIFNLKLPAELVVLSACQTGLGKEIKGEGLVGLTRGFMYAGAPRVVVSLWSVSDAGTAELMTRFYRAMLKDKMRPAEALRAAQVSLLREKRWEQPFYWAAFTLQGEWR